MESQRFKGDGGGSSVMSEAVLSKVVWVFFWFLFSFPFAATLSFGNNEHISSAANRRDTCYEAVTMLQNNHGVVLFFHFVYRKG